VRWPSNQIIHIVRDKDFNLGKNIQYWKSNNFLELYIDIEQNIEYIILFQTEDILKPLSFHYNYVNNRIENEDWSYADRELVKRQNHSYFDEKSFLICDCCYWCSSYLPDIKNDMIQHFDDCPKCNGGITSKLISENASKRLDFKHIQNILTDS
jgi:hypothetical protein